MVIRILEKDSDAEIGMTPLAECDDPVAAGCDGGARGVEGGVDDVLDGAPGVALGQGALVEEGEVRLRVGGAPDEGVGGGPFGFDVGALGEGTVGAWGCGVSTWGARGLVGRWSGRREGMGGRTFRGRWWGRCSSIVSCGEG